MRLRYGILLTLLVLLLSQPARTFGADRPLWELGAGLSLIRIPDYPGSDEGRIYPLPFPYFVYRGDVLRVDRSSISGRIFKTDRLLLDFSLYGRVPVKSSDNGARAGMPDLDPTFEVGPALNITLLNQPEERYRLTLTLTLPVRAITSTNLSRFHREGWVFNPKLSLAKGALIAGTGLNLGVSAGLLFADSGYNSYYYSVDPVFAAPARPAFTAGGGYSGASLTLSLNKEFKDVTAYAFASADFLQGTENEASPLIKSRTTVIYGLAASWIFLKSALLVPQDR